MLPQDSLLRVLDALKIGLFTQDDHGRYTSMNRAAVALFRGDEARSLPQGVSTCLSERQRETVRRSLSCVLKNERGECDGSVGLAFDALPEDPASQDALDLMQILIERSPETLARVARRLQEDSIFYG